MGNNPDKLRRKRC